ncbi:SigE family RNA polymerase sigma factor [Mangrovihabitans endophyticus]|uniref:RNA polymerase sigma24 factor n=1 Tax=Mangrovihabitans endophyticus TaxID=1751298 RepID=A0A8J3FRA9_9ACTN|nr:SigE family RNA polymerase sigma factor [Mangrovihabitans endophyticus]GGL09979.1 RNA polymerase sigma24 factor [Mangrovihabitans endophyticus]
MEDDDIDSFRAFARARFEPLRALAYVTCGDWQAAEDAVSGALARLYLRWHRVSSPDAYARTMVVRAAIGEKRRPWRREHPAGESLPERSRADPADAVDERLRLRQALWRVPPRQRAVLVLRYLEDLSVEETAEALGCRTGTVKSQCARGLTTLRAVLAAEDMVLINEKEDERAVPGPGRVGVGAGRTADAADDHR